MIQVNIGFVLQSSCQQGIGSGVLVETIPNGDGSVPPKAALRWSESSGKFRHCTLPFGFHQ